MCQTAPRALASQQSRAVGVIVPTLENPNFAIAAEAAQQRLIESGCNFSVARLTNEVQPRYVPYVVIWSLADDETPSAGIDNTETARRLALHLLDLGHRQVGVIAGLANNNDRAAARLEGIRRALSERGLELPRELLTERPNRIAEGQFALRALMATSPPSICSPRSIASRPQQPRKSPSAPSSAKAVHRRLPLSEPLVRSGGHRLRLAAQEPPHEHNGPQAKGSGAGRHAVPRRPRARFPPSDRALPLAR